jgi:hypothetical protein
VTLSGPISVNAQTKKIDQSTQFGSHRVVILNCLSQAIACGTVCVPLLKTRQVSRAARYSIFRQTFCILQQGCLIQVRTNKPCILQAYFLSCILPGVVSCLSPASGNPRHQLSLLRSSTLLPLPGSNSLYFLVSSCLACSSRLSVLAYCLPSSYPTFPRKVPARLR